MFEVGNVFIFFELSVVRGGRVEYMEGMGWGRVLGKLRMGR